MPLIGQSANLHSKLIEQALEAYALRITRAPEPFQELHAGLVIIAYGLAGQNWHRLEIIDNHTILVHNHPVW